MALNFAKALPQVQLAALQVIYRVNIMREVFTESQPTADETFVLTPENDDPLPPLLCVVWVHGLDGQMWKTIVTDVDEAKGTYTASITQDVADGRPHRPRRSRFGDHTDGLYDDGRHWDGESAV